MRLDPLFQLVPHGAEPQVGVGDAERSFGMPQQQVMALAHGGPLLRFWALRPVPTQTRSVHLRGRGSLHVKQGRGSRVAAQDPPNPAA